MKAWRALSARLAVAVAVARTSQKNLRCIFSSRGVCV
jgi:hypothetical protein